MNLIFVIFFNLLVFTGCLAANIDRKSTHNKVQKQNTTGNPAKVSSINEDFDYAMYDNSNLFQMLQLAKDPRVSEYVIKHIFPVKYLNYEFFIVANLEENFLGEKEDITSKSISIYGYNFYSDIIKYFGGSMQKLSIQNTRWIDDERSAAFHRSVNEYCADSLSQLYLASVKGNILTQFQKPFSKLTNLFIRIERSHTEPVRPFGEMFPKLKTLGFSFSPFDDMVIETNKFIESEMPQLEHLEVYGNGENTTYRTILETNLENMFQKNPQIRSMYYSLNCGDFIQVINKYLPNLEHFTISELDSEIQSAQLDHVKHFSIQSDEGSPIERLSFPQLESLSMIYSSRHATGDERSPWLTFFENHQHLRAMNCSLHDDNGFDEFLAKLPNLVTIRIKSSKDFDIDFVGRLMKNHKNLMDIQYQVSSFYYPNGPELQLYRERFENDWLVSYYKDGEYLTLKFVAKN